MRHRVAPVDRRVGVGVGRVEQRLAQPLVDLDHVHVRHALGQVLGQHAEAAADLEHDVAAVELGRAADHAEDVRVDQEVLPELAVRPHAEAAQAPQARLGRARRPRRSRPAEHARGVLLHLCLQPVRRGGPRSSARNAAVWATKAGWLRRPRTACGAR